MADIILKYTNSLVIHAAPETLAEQSYLYYQNKITSNEVIGAYRQLRSIPIDLSKYYKRDLFDLDCKNTPIIEPLNISYPQIRFLILIRNPISFIKSGLQRGYYTKSNPKVMGHLEYLDNQIYKDCNDKEEIQIYKIASFWKIIVQMAHKINSNNRKRCFILKTDQMFKDISEIKKMLEFFGIKFDNKIDNFNLKKRINFTKIL